MSVHLPHYLSDKIYLTNGIFSDEDLQYFSLFNSFRKQTNADSNFEQFCYYGQNKKDRLFNKLLAKRVNQINTSLVFQIDSVINVTKNGETKIYKAVQELKSLVKHNDRKNRDSDRQQIAKQPKLADREHFGRRTKNGRRPRFLS